jgi:hypothetical protein
MRGIAEAWRRITADKPNAKRADDNLMATRVALIALALSLLNFFGGIARFINASEITALPLASTVVAMDNRNSGDAPILAPEIGIANRASAEYGDSVIGHYLTLRIENGPVYCFRALGYVSLYLSYEDADDALARRTRPREPACDDYTSCIWRPGLHMGLMEDAVPKSVAGGDVFSARPLFERFQAWRCQERLNALGIPIGRVADAPNFNALVAEMFGKDVTLTYYAETLRDGVRHTTCTLNLDRTLQHWTARGFFNKHCGESESEPAGPLSQFRRALDSVF